MNRLAPLSASLLLAFSVGFGARAAKADDKTPAQIEAEYAREASPKGRLRLAIQLTDIRLKEMLSAYQAADADQEAAAMANYLAALDRLENGMKDFSGVLKDLEIHLRHQTEALDHLKLGLGVAEREPVEKADARVAKLHEEALGAIMRKK